MDRCVWYEQPLNERMRMLLRLEFLYARVQHAAAGCGDLTHCAAQLVADYQAGDFSPMEVLVACQATGHALPAWGHEAVGLFVLAVVCTCIAGAMAWQPRANR